MADETVSNVTPISSKLPIPDDLCGVLSENQARVWEAVAVLELAAGALLLDPNAEDEETPSRIGNAIDAAIRILNGVVNSGDEVALREAARAARG